MRTTSFDHVALWVSSPPDTAEFLCQLPGMHVIEQTSSFTLIGGHAREGKLTLFATDVPRAAGVVGRIALRVPDLDDALAALPADLEVRRVREQAHFDSPEGIPLALLCDPEATFCDLDHLVLRVTRSEQTLEGLAELGLQRDGDGLRLAGRRILVERGPAVEGSPLLNHIALLVDTAHDGLEEARERGLEVTDVKDTANTFAFFVRGPEQIVVEYVEHKPTFSLT